ncbi:histone acetyltransferase 1 [Lignoscripta atroalba]|nr:histone acetyltransferase 1 [Lignoscripta atroalba]
MADQEEWSTNANEALQISLVQPGKDALNTLSTFHPQFTYPIFGEEERIFGYQGLRVNLRFAAHDLLPNVEVSYDKKFKAVGDTQATDVEDVLREWMPASAFGKLVNFQTRIQNTPSAKDFKPPGKLIESYTSRDRKFEIWCGELTDPAVQELIDRMQVFISFFIEGGTPLDLDDQEWSLARWRVFFVYEKLPNAPTPTAASYSIVGYSTSYRFITYLSTPSQPQSKRKAKSSIQTFSLPFPNPITPSSLPSRSRISQFLILPPHQSHSHGTHLYNTMTSTFLADPACTEITVEDPNEAFDDLRDYCDYARLLQNGTFGQIKLQTSLDPKATSKRIGVRVPTSKLLDLPLLKTLRRKNKLAQRQFDRLVELYLLSRIPPHSRQAGTTRLTQRGKASDEGDRAFYYWRLLVKQRVYKKNKDVLMQLERGERIDKVEQTVGEVAGDYERLLRGLEGMSKNGNGNGVASVEGGGERRERGKRKVVVDEEDEEDEDGGGEREAKRRKAEQS